MRINKFLASAGLGSRRKVEEFVLDGKVKVNGIVVKNLATDVDANVDLVEFNNNAVQIAQNFEYYLLNKPKGYICTASDDRGRKNVVELINTKTRIYPVGRLDYDTEGLLILTNDGELTNKLTHPRNHIKKTYLVCSEQKLTESDIKKIETGIEIEGKKTLPAQLNFVSKTFDDKSEYKYELTIFEGRNRQIRKMFEAINKPIKWLRRIKIENLKLTGLNRGEYRFLTPSEVRYLKNLWKTGFVARFYLSSRSLTLFATARRISSLIAA